MAEPVHSLIVRLELGPIRTEWCDGCLVSHAFADLLNVTERGVSRMATWGDHAEED